MDASFKTCMFGGFDRQDVVAFIEKTAEEHRVETETLRAENEQLRRERDAAVAENEALRCLTEEDARLQEDNNRLQRRVEELQGKLAEVQAENDTLRGPAGEYQSLKEHIADIEISAHRRTEQFREEAVTRLRQLAARQREWCRTAQADYEQMNCQLLERLQQAEQTLRQPDMSSFRRMEEGLTALEKGLTAPEKAGE